MEEENKNEQPFEQNGKNLEENKSSAENISVENIEKIANSEDLFGFDEKNQNREVVVIYEQPQNGFQDAKNKDKKFALIFSLLGLLFSVFYIGIVFSFIGFVLTMPKIKEIKKSSLVKWSLITSICGFIISLIFITALNIL